MAHLLLHPPRVSLDESFPTAKFFPASEPLCLVIMAHGRPKGVGSIIEHTGKVQRKLILQHGRYLLFTGITVAGDGLFYLSWSVFRYLKALSHGSGHTDALCAPQLEHRLWVFAKERTLDGHHGWLVCADHLGQPPVNSRKSLCMVREFRQL